MRLLTRAKQCKNIFIQNRPGLIQENEARLVSGIFAAGNGGSAALEPVPSPRGLLGTPRQTEISVV